MDLTYYKEANALYIKLSHKKIIETLTLGDNVFLDVDSDNKPVGIEYLLSKELPAETLEILQNSNTNSIESRLLKI